MTLAHEQPLAEYNFHPSIGGSAGNGTHGGTEHVNRPPDMPTKQDATHVVETKDALLSAITTDDAIIYIDDDIDVTGVAGQEVGNGITLVGGFCDPSIDGRGPVIHSDDRSKYVFTSSYGTAPTLWGVSFRGPETNYTNPDHTAGDFNEKFSSAFFCYDDNGTFDVYGCEFFGWTLAGLGIGAKNHPTRAIVERSSFHHNQMEHLGYGIQHYNGYLSIDRCFFDKCRHGVSSFGYATGGYAIANSVIGPGPWCGHALDMHDLAANKDSYDGPLAGEFIRVYQCTLMSTWDRGGYDQEGMALRGISDKTSYIDKSNFWHEHTPDPTGGQGSAYRQATDAWQSFEPRDNVFGKGNFGDGSYGAPRQDDTTDDSQNKSMQTLVVDGYGQGTGGTYEIKCSGTAETGSGAESNEQVIDNDDGTVTLTGGAYARDTFELSQDAQLLSYRAKGRFKLLLDGTKVDVGPLLAVTHSEDMATQDDSTHDHSKLKSRVDQLSNDVDSLTTRLQNATLDFGFSDSK